MAKTLNINEYTSEKRCVYKDRIYFVRDNGAVYRQAKSGLGVRKYDEEWTFGKLDKSNGYLMIGSERVHRIVCTAFHGEPEGDRNIADHIDTNRQNNRPENLHWVTKLENVIGNPITRAKIETICGSIQAFLDKPSILRGHEHENPNFTWMRAVTPEEAKASYKRWKEWAEKSIEERKSKSEYKGLGEWIFGKEEMVEASKWNGGNLYRPYKSYAQQRAEIEAETIRYEEERLALKDSLTPGAKQLHWKTPTEFPLCPPSPTDTPLQDYLNALVEGQTFCKNQYYHSEVVKAEIASDCQHLAVITTTSGVTNFALTEIRYENGFYIHESIRTFFTGEGAEKYYTLSLGKVWTGGDVMEDFC